jgi:hypothetical protein
MLLGIVIICLLGALPTPAFAANFSSLPYLVNKSWSQEYVTTWTAQGTGIDNGNYRSVTDQNYTITLISLSQSSFTVSKSWQTRETVTASGSWVEPAGVTCSGCTAITTSSGSGTLTYDRATFTVTAAGGDYTSGNIGRKLADIVDPSTIASEGQIMLWWYDQTGQYQIVPYSVVRNDQLDVGGNPTRVFVVAHRGISRGYWGVGSSRSNGQLTRTFEYDKSTGVQLTQHAEGTFSFQRSGGGWTETESVDMTTKSVKFLLGDYVVIGSNPPTPVVVDGSVLATSELPKLYVWPWDSSHTISARSTQEISTGSRLVFQSWSDGVKDLNRTVTANTPGELTANYKRQYLLTVLSPYGGTVGSGWYYEGSAVNVHVDSSAFFVLVFSGWSGYPLPANPDAQLTMSGPVTLQANWKLDIARLSIVIAIIAGIIFGILLYRRHRISSMPKPYDRPITRPLRFCILCGAELRPAARFCTKCGAQQP